MYEHISYDQVKMLKIQYNDLYVQLEPIVNSWDPIGLISGGAPKDEYDCLTVQLILLLKEGKRPDDIYEFIIHELDDHFGIAIDSLPGEYKEKAINKHRVFSKNLVEWYTSN
ncbi:hypothetical protein D3C73_1254000 [compost metagenome]